MRVKVNNGKYEFVKDGLKIKILRYGEEWHEQQDAFNALCSIMHALDAARVVLECARNMRERGVCPPDLLAALKKHEALVDDKEMPSEWTR